LGLSTAGNLHKYPSPVAFEHILIAFFGCVLFEETTSSDLSEKVNLLIGKTHRFS